ncbi:internal scaffolding protein [Microviridae sp.]|nr:internal scaffolding protein [Microviridae sp.]
MKFRTAYDKSKRYTFETNGKSRTHQSMSPECDINTIMKKYERTGVLEHRNTFEGQYGDFTNAPEDYHASMNAVIEANEMFDTLPAKVRRRFHNDPGAFIDFVGNPDNKDELIKLGLATKPAEEVIEKSATPPPNKAETPPTPKPKGSTETKSGD